VQLIILREFGGDGGLEVRHLRVGLWCCVAAGLRFLVGLQTRYVELK
jgi:hypothetical protein